MAKRSKVLVSDHEFGEVWIHAKTVYCSNHMKRNIQEYLQKIGKNSKVDRQPIIALFHRMINLTSLEKFESLKKDHEKGEMTDGALADA